MIVGVVWLVRAIGIVPLVAAVGWSASLALTTFALANVAVGLGMVAAAAGIFAFRRWALFLYVSSVIVGLILVGVAVLGVAESSAFHVDPPLFEFLGVPIAIALWVMYRRTTTNK